MAFKKASRLSQSKLVRPIADHLPTGYEELTGEQKRDCLKAILLSVEADLIKERDKFRRKALGKEKFMLQEEMHKIRPKKKCPDAGNYLMTAIKQIYGLAASKLVMDLAVKLSKEDK